ncbi:MAG: pirin family protein [Actinomycetales bacterium]
MSDLQQRPALTPCGGSNEHPERECFEVIDGRPVALTTRLTPTKENPRQGLPVERFLPAKQRRMVGAWCFVDRFGPVDISDTEGMMVGPHPHTGLQTVTWLFEGSVQHRDSLANDVVIEPGQLNLMTAGQGISHSEESPTERPAGLHGIQLWIALPDHDRDQEPAFEHFESLPCLKLPGIRATVLVGELGGVSSPARVWSKLVGAVVTVTEGAGQGANAWLPLRTRFEYAVLPIDGEVEVDGQPLSPEHLYYLGLHRDGVDLTSQRGARFLLLGGEPFGEELVMWWNFVARNHDEIVTARALWNAHAPLFGRVSGSVAERITAPVMPAGVLRPQQNTPSGQSPAS